MKDVYSPPRQHPHTAGEVAQFHKVRDHEAAGIKALVTSAIKTLGAPAKWTEVLAIVVPIAIDAGSELVKATHPESPGGATITRSELEDLAHRTGREVEKALLRELLHLASPDPESDGSTPTDRVIASGISAGVPATGNERPVFATATAPAGSVPLGPTPTIDPAELAGKTATITRIAPTTLPPDSVPAAPVQPATAVPPSAPAVPPIPAPAAPAPAPTNDPLKAA